MLKSVLGCTTEENDSAFFAHEMEHKRTGAKDGKDDPQTNERETHSIATTGHIREDGECSEQQEQNASEKRAAAKQDEALSQTEWHASPSKQEFWFASRK